MPATSGPAWSRSWRRSTSTGKSAGCFAKTFRCRRKRSSTLRSSDSCRPSTLSCGARRTPATSSNVPTTRTYIARKGGSPRSCWWTAGWRPSGPTSARAAVFSFESSRSVRSPRPSGPPCATRRRTCDDSLILRKSQSGSVERCPLWLGVDGTSSFRGHDQCDLDHGRNRAEDEVPQGPDSESEHEAVPPRTAEEQQRGRRDLSDPDDEEDRAHRERIDPDGANQHRPRSQLPADSEEVSHDESVDCIDHQVTAVDDSERRGGDCGPG